MKPIRAWAVVTLQGKIKGIFLARKKAKEWQYVLGDRVVRVRIEEVKDE